MTYQKALTDAVTGQTIMVDLSPEEVQEVEARIVAHQAAEAARIVAEQAAEVEAAELQDVLKSLPSAEDIASAKNIADLKDFMTKQAAAIRLLTNKANS